MKYQINKEHIGYYKTLERIRRSGICNMWGAAPHLAEMEKYRKRKLKKFFSNG